MSWSDERIAAEMRKIDPAKTVEDASPGPADWARMRSATVAPAPRQVFMRPVLRWAWAVPAIAVIAAVALAVEPLAAAPSYASTPPALVAEALSDSPEQIIDESVQTLGSEPATTPTRDAEVVRWAFRDGSSDDPVIVPEWQAWVWNDDGTGYLSAKAGAPYSVTYEGQIVAPAADAPLEGSAIDRPEETMYRYGYFPEAPPSDAGALRRYLQDSLLLAPNADALAWWGAISALRDEWTLAPSQQAAALEILQQTGGLSVLGAVVDRFGRDGIALSISSTARQQFGATIVLDASSRQIIAADILYLGGHESLDIEPGSVIQYSAWLLPPQ